MGQMKIGFGVGDITPHGGKSSLEGQFEVRITDEVRDPLLAVCMFIEKDDNRSIWVSVDANHVFKSLSNDVDALLEKQLPGFKPGMLMMNATHIHTGPYHDRGEWLSLTGIIADDEGAMTAAEYRQQMAQGVVDAVMTAWESLEEARIEIAIAPVITGVSRRVVYKNGTAKMYGSVDGDDFYRMEARDGGPSQLMYVYSAATDKLIGIAADIPCPAQCAEHELCITADYFAIVRSRLKANMGNVPMICFIRSAGDLSPHPMVDRLPGDKKYQTGFPCMERMGSLVADFVEICKNRSFMKIDGSTFATVSREITLPVWKVTDEEYQAAKNYLSDDSHYNNDGSPKNRFDHANAWTRVHRVEKDSKQVKTRINAVRIDNVVMVSMPFEVYISIADRIRRHFPDVLIFDIELTYDNLGYLPTKEAIAGGHYSANIFNGVCDTEGVEKFICECEKTISQLFE